MAEVLAPALAVGCTMVLKPGEVAPLSAYLWAQVMHVDQEIAEALMLGQIPVGAREQHAIVGGGSPPSETDERLLLV